MGMLGIAIVAATFALGQFQLGLGVYAVIYPQLTKGVPYTKLQTVLAAKTSTMANGTWHASSSTFVPSTLGEDLLWTIERVPYNHKTAIKVLFSSQDYYVVKPEWIAILAHCAPIVTGMAFRFGIQS